MPKNSVHPLSYNKSQESNKKRPGLILNYFLVYMCPETPFTPFLATGQSKVTKINHF